LDGIGVGLVALFLGTLQIMLDKGQDADWFGAVWVRWFALICALSLVAFVVWELSITRPLVDLHVLKNRNFAVSCILFGLFGFMVYALITIQPLFLQSLLGYNAFNSGLSVSPRGFGALVALFFVGALVHRVDARILAGIGFMMMGIASFLLCRLTLQMAMSSVVVPNILAGFATGCLFVPLTTLAVGTLSNQQIGNAIGLQNLIRNIGGSIGLSVVSTLLQRFSQAHQFLLVGQMSPLNLQYLQKRQAIQSVFEQRFNPVDALAHAQGTLYNTLLRQSSYWAFMDLFFLIACICVLCVLAIVLYAKPQTVHAVSASE
jgi:DHA2 family multidrug resistance protein